MPVIALNIATCKKRKNKLDRTLMHYQITKSALRDLSQHNIYIEREREREREWYW